MCNNNRVAKLVTVLINNWKLMATPEDNKQNKGQVVLVSELKATISQMLKEALEEHEAA